MQIIKDGAAIAASYAVKEEVPALPSMDEILDTS